MSDYKHLFGVEHLKEISTSVSLAFDTETLQLQPEVGKLRLIQIGCESRRTIVIIDCFELDEGDWDKLRLFFTNGEDGASQDAIAVALEHVDGECITSFLPYRKRFLLGYKYDALVAQPTEKRFWMEDSTKHGT